jgi:hypothetical protein
MLRIAATMTLSLLAVLAWTAAADAGARRERVYVDDGGAEHPRSATYHRKKPQVRGFVARRGGYSYSYEDTINTYGQSRTLYGSTNVYRDPSLDKQTPAGPFDHGFFFNSGIAPRGGDSPYMN